LSELDICVSVRQLELLIHIHRHCLESVVATSSRGEDICSRKHRFVRLAVVGRERVEWLRRPKVEIMQCERVVDINEYNGFGSVHWVI
jgi:cytochrome b subunit of formate dehydrogenase